MDLPGHTKTVAGRFRITDLAAVVIAAAALGCVFSVAVLQGRERSNRRVCRRQIGELVRGLLLYEAAHRRLPPAATWARGRLDASTIFLDQHHPWPNITAIPPGTGPDITVSNWAVELLPYLGLAELQIQFAPGELISSDTNQTLRESQPSVWICPSDQLAAAKSYARPGGTGVYARGNYAINGGSQRDCPEPGWPSDPCPDGYEFKFDVVTESFQWTGNGIAGINRGITRREILAGASHVVAVDEIRAGLDADDPRGVWSLGQIGASITWGHGIHGDAAGPNSRSIRSDDILGCRALTRRYGATRLQELGMPCCAYCPGNQQATARSQHPGGVQVGWLDGAASFVSDQIDPGLWHVTHSRETPDKTYRH